MVKKKDQKDKIKIEKEREREIARSDLVRILTISLMKDSF